MSLLTPSGECFAAAGYDEALVAPLTARDLTLLGAFAPTARSSAALTVQLAVGELGYLPEGDDAGRAPLITVLCDDTAETIDVVLEHLVGELGAHALLASLEDIALRAALEHPATRDQVFYLSPYGSDTWSSPTSAVPPLLWHLGASYSRVLAAYPPLLERALLAFRNAGGDLATFRVAVVESDAREDRDLAAAVLEELALFQDLSQLRREGRLRTFESGRVQREPEDLLEFAPQLLLFFAGGLDPSSPYPERASLVRLLESAEQPAPGFSPFYVFGPRNLWDATLEAFASESESFRRRAVGVTAERPLIAERAAALRQRSRARLINLPPEVPARLSFSVYDGLYHLASAFAAAPASEPPRTALEVAESFRRVTAPEGVPFDLAAPLPNLRALGGGKPSSLNGVGTTGPAAFDPDQTRSGAVRLYCWGAGGELSDVPGYDVAQPATLAGSACARDFLGGGG